MHDPNDLGQCGRLRQRRGMTAGDVRGIVEDSLDRCVVGPQINRLRRNNASVGSMIGSHPVLSRTFGQGRDVIGRAHLAVLGVHLRQLQAAR